MDARGGSPGFDPGYTVEHPSGPNKPNWWLRAFVLALILGFGALCVYAPLKYRHDQKEKLEHSACADVDDNGVRQALKDQTLKVEREVDPIQLDAHGPTTVCNYATNGSLHFTVSVWCGDAASDARNQWKSADNPKVVSFSVNAAFVVVSDEAMLDENQKRERKPLKRFAAAVKQGQKRTDVCPTPKE